MAAIIPATTEIGREMLEADESFTWRLITATVSKLGRRKGEALSLSQRLQCRRLLGHVQLSLRARIEMEDAEAARQAAAEDSEQAEELLPPPPICSPSPGSDSDEDEDEEVVIDDGLRDDDAITSLDEEGDSNVDSGDGFRPYTTIFNNPCFARRPPHSDVIEAEIDSMCEPMQFIDLDEDQDGCEDGAEEEEEEEEGYYALDAGGSMYGLVISAVDSDSSSSASSSSDEGDDEEYLAEREDGDSGLQSYPLRRAPSTILAPFDEARPGVAHSSSVRIICC